MIEHPYDCNKGAYNFFFHPLHNVEKTIVAICVNIALTILSLRIWQLPFWIVNRLDNRKVEDWTSSVFAQKVESAAATIFNGATRPIENSGRIRHGANTCFIAAAIQFCRQLPVVLEALKIELQRKEEESDEKFELGRSIHQLLKSFLIQIEMGHEITPEKVEHLHSLLHRYDNYSISSPGKCGDPEVTFRILLNVLSIVADKAFHGDSAGYSKVELRPIITDFRYVLPKEVKLKRTLYMEEDDFKTEVNYKLVGIACYDSGHAIAYLKDLAHPSDEFIMCDDMDSYKKVKDIELNKHIENSCWPFKRFFMVYIPAE